MFYIQATSKGLATPARNWGSLSRLLLPKALSTFERMVDLWAHGSVLSKVPVSQVGAPPVGKSNTCFNYSPELKQQLANTKTPLGSPLKTTLFGASSRKTVPMKPLPKTRSAPVGQRILGNQGVGVGGVGCRVWGVESRASSLGSLGCGDSRGSMSRVMGMKASS